LAYNVDDGGGLARAGRSLMGEGLFTPLHLAFVLVIVLILFGPGKLPDLGRGLGKGIREFKDALKGGITDSNGKKTEETKPEEKKS
jgi:sec-independent protein translocase protein TatA